MSHHIQKLIQNIDLKVRNKRIKLLKQSIGSNLHLPGLENGFLDKTHKQQKKSDIGKVKNSIKNVKMQSVEWIQTLTNHVSDRGICN